LVKDATAAFAREMMRAAHELNGPTFAHAILTTKELLAALPTTSAPLLSADSTVERFWKDFAADPKHSVPEADRRIYALAYGQPGGMRAGFEYFRNFERDAQDFAQLGATPLTVLVLVLTGEKARLPNRTS
jgi:hypothetical protein